MRKFSKTKTTKPTRKCKVAVPVRGLLLHAVNSTSADKFYVIFTFGTWGSFGVSAIGLHGFKESFFNYGDRVTRAIFTVICNEKVVCDRFLDLKTFQRSLPLDSIEKLLPFCLAQLYTLLFYCRENVLQVSYGVISTSWPILIRKKPFETPINHPKYVRVTVFENWDKKSPPEYLKRLIYHYSFVLCGVFINSTTKFMSIYISKRKECKV